MTGNRHDADDKESDDSDPQDTELYCVKIKAKIYHRGAWGANAAHKGLKKHFSRRDVVRERVDAVPIEELEALVDKWMETGTDDYDHGTNDYDIFTGKQRLKCAQELSSLIQEYRGEQ